MIYTSMSQLNNSAVSPYLASRRRSAARSAHFYQVDSGVTADCGHRRFCFQTRILKMLQIWMKICKNGQKLFEICKKCSAPSRPAWSPWLLQHSPAQPQYSPVDCRRRYCVLKSTYIGINFVLLKILKSASLQHENKRLDTCRIDRLKTFHRRYGTKAIVITVVT